MSTTIAREQLLRTVRSVIPGLTARAIQEQSDSIGFKDGYATTYNEAVFCRAPSGLPKELTAVVKAKKLITILDKMPDVEIAVEVIDGRFVLSGNRGRRRIKFAMEKEVLLPIDTILTPKKDDWIRIHDDFTDAIGVVGECASTNAQAPRFTCVHIHPKFMEACDGDQLLRYPFNTGVKAPILVKRDSLRYVPGADPTHMAETDSWIFFRNAEKLVIACKRFAEKYGDMSAMLDVKGTKSVLPKSLITEAEIAAEFTKDDVDNNMIRVELVPGKLRISGTGDAGESEGFSKIKYSGPAMRFWVSPKLLIEVVKRQSDCEIDPKKYHLRVVGEKFTYVACLERSKSKKGADE
jgi:DNA polymerase III sliding clamp (beta) subunit (PCNA family)